MRQATRLLQTTALLILAWLPTCVWGETVKFQDAPAGALPPGWVGTQTGKGTAAWTIARDKSSPGKLHVLKQSGEADYPVCIKQDTRLKDGIVEAHFKPLAGKEDQAGGVIWRVKDKDNYYVCRANALEGNVVLYKTVDGTRKALDIVGRNGGYGVKAPVAPAQWHTLRVDFHGSRFAVTFDGKHLFDVEDDTLREAGHVGVWTKADSVTEFDYFTYEEAK